MPTLITQPDQLTSDWLTQVLHAKGHLPTGAVTAVSAEPSRPGASLIVPLEAAYSADAPASAPKRLIFKSSGGQLAGAGKGEVEFYRATAGKPDGLPILRGYAAEYSGETGEFYLLMEDLSETHAAHPPSMLPPIRAQAEMIVDAFAHLHAYWWDNPYRLSALGYLLYPAWQWAADLPDFIWWHHAERTWLAFHELKCEDLLGEQP